MTQLKRAQGETTRTAPANETGALGQVRRFLDWWLAELVGLLPESTRSKLGGEERQVALAFEGETLRLTDLRGGQSRLVSSLELAGMSDKEARDLLSRTLDRTRLAGCEMVLALPEHLVLRRRDSLPAETAPRLGDILNLTVESAAPLPQGALYWGYRIVEKTAAGRLVVESVIVKSEAVEPLTERLSALGITLSGIFPKADLPAQPTLNLLPAQKRREAPSVWSPLNKGLAGLAGVLAILAVAMAFYRQEATLDALRAEQAELRDRARSVLAMRADADERLRAVRAVRESRSSSRSLMDVLNEVSRVLPDGTWVHDFRLRGTEIQLMGQSQSASSLIEMFDGSPAFDQVRFESPIVRDPRSGKERFNMQLEWTTPERATSKGDGGSE